MLGSLGLATLESNRMDRLKKELLKTEGKSKIPAQEEDKKPVEKK
jgi:hypothetical protein